MGISLAPDQAIDDPLKPKKPVTLAPQIPGQAGGAAPTPMVGSIPTPTVAAPSAPVDRVKLATDIFNTTAASTQGAYDATSRENVHNSAAQGQVASGGLRTREGNLQLARGRDLDLLRRNVTNDAVTGSIEDAKTAFGQQMGVAQQGLAEKLGLGGMDIQKATLALDEKVRLKELSVAERNQALAELSQQQSNQAEQQRIQLAKEQGATQADIQRQSLALEREKFATGAGQTQQQIDLQKQRDDINAKYQAGTLTLAEKDQALRELANTQQYGLALNSQNIQQQTLELNRQIQTGQLTLVEAQQRLDEAYRGKQITLAEKDQALRELAQSQGNQNEQQRIQLAKDSLAQTGAQFGLSLAQQKDLATLADKTQNRQLDIASSQGRNSLLLELARIMGGTSGNIDPEFLKAVMAALGFGPPPNKTDVLAQGNALPIHTDTANYNDASQAKPTDLGGIGLAKPDTGMVY